MTTDEPFGPPEGRIPADGANDGDGWMARFADLDDRSVDLLLGGSTPAGMDDLAPIAEFAAAVRAHVAERRPEMSRALRAQIHAGPPVAPRHVGAVRRRLVLAGVAAFVAVAAAASQNALPASAQRLVSNVGDVVGIDIPRPEDDDDSSTIPSGAEDPANGDQPEGTEAPGGTEGEGPGGSDGANNNGNGNSDDAPRGEGATPADPGTPGDGEPATPATPPTTQDNGNAGGNGNANTGGNAGGNGNATGGGTANSSGASSGQGAKD